MYKALNTLEFLSGYDLPHSVRLFQNDVSIGFLNLLTSETSLAAGHAFLMNFIPSNDHFAMLFFMSGLIIAITQKKSVLAFFDSHSRNINPILNFCFKW